MYCKNCGRKLEDTARFCDRCGQMAGTVPPRQKPQGRQDTDNAGRNNKRFESQGRDSYSEYRKKKMQNDLDAKRRKKKTRILVIWVAIITIVAAVGGGIFANRQTKSQLEAEKAKKTGVTPTETATEQADESSSEEPEETSENKQSAEKSETADNPDVEVYRDSMYDFKCPCPSYFEQGTLANNNTRLSLSDPDGDGKMLICCEKISGNQSPAVLMREYVNGIGVEPDFNRAGTNWYAVTFTRNSKTNHRKAIIIDNSTYMYYDFSYNSASDNKSKYEEFIEYADGYLDKQYKTKANETEDE